MTPAYEIKSLSESALVISFEQIIDERINDFVLLLNRQINAEPFPGFVESVPAYASLTIYYNVALVCENTKLSPSNYVHSYARQVIEDLRFNTQDEAAENIIEVPVIYDGEDLEHVCKTIGLTKSEFVEVHTAPLYRVYMMGFLPGFAYLGGMDKRLAVPRRDSPRLKVPAGSVGIAGEQTGIYPLDSPGGWQLIGRTNVELFINHTDQITLLKVGGYVKFSAENIF